MTRPDRPEIQVARQGDYLVPCSEFDAELIRRHPTGVVLRAELFEPRSLPHHRLYWAVLRVLWESTQLHPNPEALHDELKRCCGYQDRSTGMQAMSAEEWREYSAFALEAVREGLAPHLSIDEVLELGRPKLSQDEQAALDPGQV